MNYYIVPGEIAESLDLTTIRKKSPGGMFLLSESDLLPYGIERAMSDGAIILSDNNPEEQTADNTPPDQAEDPAEEVSTEEKEVVPEVEGEETEEKED